MTKRDTEVTTFPFTDEEGYEFCRAVSKKVWPYCTDEELEDHAQNGFIGFMSAKKLYSPELAKTFKTFLYIKIRGAIIDSIRSLRGRRGQKDFLSYGDEAYDYASSTGESDLEPILRLREFERYLNSSQIEIIHKFYLGYGQNEIADELGVSRSRISQRIGGILFIIEGVNNPDSEVGQLYLSAKRMLERLPVVNIANNLGLPNEAVREVAESIAIYNSDSPDQGTNHRYQEILTDEEYRLFLKIREGADPLEIESLFGGKERASKLKQSIKKRVEMNDRF